MSVVMLRVFALRTAVSHVRTFSVTKVFDVTLRRGYAESNSNENDVATIDPCEAMDSSTGKITHKSLKPPPEISPCIFRKFTEADEPLGPGADKFGDYKNPEYYGYHVYSFTDVLVDILKMAEEREKAKRKEEKEIAEAKAAEAEAKAAETEAKAAEAECKAESEPVDRAIKEPKNEPHIQMSCTSPASSEESKTLEKPKDEPRIQMVCSFTDSNEEGKPSKSLQDTQISSCNNDKEIADKDDDDFLDCEDEFIKLCEALTKYHKHDGDDEC